MRRTASILLAGALALGAVAANDAQTTQTPTDLTDHPCYDDTVGDLVFPEQQVWFHEGESKLGNTAETAAPWDTTEPETSVTGGAGAGTVTPGVATLGSGTPAEQWATFQGTFEGCLDTLLLEIYSFDLSNRSGHGGVTGAPDCLPDCVPSGQPAIMDIGLQIVVDGVTTHNLGPIEIATEFDNEGAGPNLNSVAVDMATMMDTLADCCQVALDGTHDITVRVRNWYANTGHSMFVWDTSEVPSGLTFNGAVPEGVPTF